MRISDVAETNQVVAGEIVAILKKTFGRSSLYAMHNRWVYPSVKYLPLFRTLGAKVRWQRLPPDIAKPSTWSIAICRPMIATAMVEVMGFLSVCTMVACYGLEERSPVFTLVFSGACAVAALYAFLIGSFPFMIAEGIWAIVAYRKWAQIIDRPT